MAKPGSKPKDISGRRFGKLIAMRPDNKKPSCWRCKCDCGGTGTFLLVSLQHGAWTNCGCAPQRAKFNLLGKRFGRLTVIAAAGSHKGRCWVWRCQCTCGKVKDIESYQLTSGHDKSCGCRKRAALAFGRGSQWKMGPRSKPTIAKLRARGWTLQRIAMRYGGTHQAIQQRIKSMKTKETG